MSQDIRSNGLKGWGAFCSVATIALWLFCAVMCFYKGVWQGKLFFAPGLQGLVEHRELEKRNRNDGAPLENNVRGTVAGSDVRNVTDRYPQPDGSH